MSAVTMQHAPIPANGTALAEGLVDDHITVSHVVESGDDVRGGDDDATVEVSLAPLPEETVAEVRSEVGRLRTLIEEALLRQRDQLAAARHTIEDQRVEIARLREQVDQHAALTRAQVEAVRQQARALAQANAQFRAALADRDRRLVLFARKVEQLRSLHQRRAEQRRDLLAKLRDLPWWKAGERQRILVRLEALDAER